MKRMYERTAAEVEVVEVEESISFDDKWSVYNNNNLFAESTNRASQSLLVPKIATKMPNAMMLVRAQAHAKS